MKAISVILLFLFLSACSMREGVMKLETADRIEDTLSILNGNIMDTLVSLEMLESESMSLEVGDISEMELPRSSSKEQRHEKATRGFERGAKAVASEEQVRESSSIASGTLIWTVPEKVKWGEVFEVVALISKDTLVVTTTSSRRSVIKRIPVTPKMDVVLMSVQPDAMDISSNNVSSQIVEDGERTEWRWDCKAKKVGEIRLKLIVSKVEDGGIKSKVFEGSTRVTVAVGPMISHFLEKNWQWIIATIVIPLLLWWWRSKKVDKWLKNWFVKLRS